MLRVIAILLLLGIASSRANAQAYPTRAEDLLPSCSANGVSQAADGSIVDPSYGCRWYLRGFLDGLGAEPGSIRIRTVCLPEEGFSIDQIRRVVVKWLQDHPEKLNLYVAQAVRTALQEAFPCKK